MATARKTKPAEEVIQKSLEAGEEVQTVTDDEGNEFKQRPMSLGEDDAKPAGPQPGERVRVYNKVRSRLHCSDCILDPESEGDILVSDLDVPGIKANVIKVQ